MDEREAKQAIKRMSYPFVHQVSGSLYRPGWSEIVYSNPLVICDGIALPQSSGYVWGKATIVDSARNAMGRMIGDIIRADVAKIELTWKFLYREDIEVIGMLPFINNVEFYYPPLGGFVTRKMYTSDFTGGTPMLKQGFDENGLPAGHDNVRIALIEV